MFCSPVVFAKERIQSAANAILKSRKGPPSRVLSAPRSESVRFPTSLR